MKSLDWRWQPEDGSCQNPSHRSHRGSEGLLLGFARRNREKPALWSQKLKGLGSARCSASQQQCQDASPHLELGLNLLSA